MKYLVFWIISFTITVPCDEPSEDPYRPGIVISSYNMAHCYITKRDTLHKFFQTKAEAESFVVGANDRGDVESIWIDSTVVPKPKPKGLSIDTSLTFQINPSDSLLITTDSTGWYRIGQ